MSVMLVAVASFVLHAAAMAVTADCMATRAVDHHRQAAAHVHGDGSLHVHAQADVRKSGSGVAENRDAGQDDSCCSKACVAALAAKGPGAILGPMVPADAFLPERLDGAGMRPDDVRRPPRTPGIA
jgi:hypothetical protein